MNIKLRLGKHTRCDIVAYKAINLSGKRTILRVFPTGSVKGKIAVEDLKSMIIRAPYGMRLILCTVSTDNWEDHPYRCVTMIKGKSIPSLEPNALPGIRLADLDYQDKADCKRLSENLLRSYSITESFAEGEGWSFGRVGNPKLKSNVKMIIFERVAEGEDPPVSEAENMARMLLKQAEESDIFDALREKAMQTLKQKREKASLEKWVTKHISK